MTFLKTITIGAAAIAMSAGIAYGNQHMTKPVKVVQYGEEIYLADMNQMTLYTFDKDADGVSNCNGDCAVKWPPLVVDAMLPMDAGYSLVTRADGSSQVAYHGQPLYTWFKDAKPGDMTGDGVKGVWHVARP